ncbi:bifunctional sugar-1-phosphate nucleotidylyltransferase/acetyltransferase [Natronomonas sp.]|jgi:bifunctional UDP-N-acetylglucosamine pyrophosphorylase/glucosamine-1-phosphate N-acetyltransferase|uniref:bifunctional sugar-1-phosphate nucleotidylyltransferase/acetyltransferase n=1 Tax=Natronomonas sp. TaxID=2184060 RepID=UPI00398A0817
MDAVIIAAGKGTRMRPLTERRPKPLLPVGASTLIERTMGQCVDIVDRFVVVVGYRADDIRDAIGTGYEGTPVEYVTQEEALGTAHAIGQASEVVENRFLVLNGDVVVDDTLPRELADADGAAMAVQPVENPGAYGVVETERGVVTDLVEKPDEPPSNLINTGVYAFTSSVFGYIDETEQSPRGEYEITDTIGRLLADGRAVEAVEYDGVWRDVGRPWELLDVTDIALSDLDTQLDGTIEDDSHLHGAVVVEDGARVRSGAYVEGPVVIRSGADVGPNAYVRGPTVIGPGVRVGNGVEIKHSVLFSDAAVGHLSYVGDSVLGADVNFGAGTVVANLRHDDAPVRMDIKGESVDTGRRKLGVVVGDEAKTGINTSLNAGVRLGVGATTTPGESVLTDRL